MRSDEGEFWLAAAAGRGRLVRGGAVVVQVPKSSARHNCRRWHKSTTASETAAVLKSIVWPVPALRGKLKHIAYILSFHTGSEPAPPESHPSY